MFMNCDKISLSEASFAASFLVGLIKLKTLPRQLLNVVVRHVTPGHLYEICQMAGINFGNIVVTEIQHLHLP